MVDGKGNRIPVGRVHHEGADAPRVQSTRRSGTVREGSVAEAQARDRRIKETELSMMLARISEKRRQPGQAITYLEQAVETAKAGRVQRLLAETKAQLAGWLRIAREASVDGLGMGANLGAARFTRYKCFIRQLLRRVLAPKAGALTRLRYAPTGNLSELYSACKTRTVTAARLVAKR
jgi:hypothetical protein